MNLCSTKFNAFWGLSYNITYKVYINVSLITALMISIFDKVSHKSILLAGHP